jgi:NTP pyrophosphatase (non-canonical NTP hydrolase)
MAKDLNELKEEIKKFNLERDWDKFHNVKDLIIALTSEVGELAECYRWLSEDEISKIHSNPEKKKNIEEEIADIFIYLLIISYKTDIDIFDVIEKKLEKNKQKYPIDKSKSIHTNPLEGFKGK